MDKIVNKLDEQRYKRHILLQEVGKKGQEKLKNSSVLVIGAGGLGCPILMYLAAAGVGTIGVVDFDIVDLSNLQRQVIYSENDLGKSKVTVIKQKLTSMNSDIIVNCVEDKFDSQNAEQIVSKYDIIIDATDNFETRYLISDTCVKLDKVEIYGAIFEFFGQVAVLGKDCGCLRCLSPKEIQGEDINSQNAGVIGAVAGVIGSMQAIEAIKCIIESPKSLKGRMIFVDLLNMTFEDMQFSKNDKCPVCNKRSN